MPTGYTADFQNKDVSFDEFVWTSARAFGAFSHMRDSNSDAKIEMPVYDDYQDKQLAKALQEVEDLKNMSIKMIEAKMDADHARQVADAKDGITRHKALRARYTKVLNQTQAWNPPSKEHQGLKDFMIQQLTQSIEFDCDEKYYHDILERPRSTPNEWLTEQLKHAEWSVTYHTDQLAKYKVSFAKNIKWIQDLQSAVPMVTK